MKEEIWKECKRTLVVVPNDNIEVFIKSDFEYGINMLTKEFDKTFAKEMIKYAPYFKKPQTDYLNSIVKNIRKSLFPEATQ